MRINKGDYLIVANHKREKSKKHLFKAREVDKKDVTGIYEHMRHIPKLRQVGTISFRDVLINLGPDPAVGKVYGIEVGERYQGAVDHEHFGQIHLFYKMEKDVKKDLFLACDKVYKILRKLGIEFILDGVIWEIVPVTGGKFAGMHILSRKGDEVTNRIKLQLESDPASEYVYLILHELGHQLHKNYVTSNRLNARWIKLFNTSIKPQNIKKEVSSTLLENLLAGEDMPSDYRRLLPAEDQAAYRWVLRSIAQTYGISVNELDILFEADEKEDIRRIWPTRTISHKELEPVISEYACKSYKETLAETFALMYTKRNREALPDTAIRLMEKSISFAKTQREKS